MIIVFPLASSDRNHAPSFLKLLTAFGPYLEDRALILPTPSAMYDPLLGPVVEGIKALFASDKVHVEMTQNDMGATWPYSPGCHFKFAMEVIDGLDKEWHEESLWMEPDFMPACKDWLKLIKDDYRMASTPFRGMLEKTRYIDSTLQKQPDGTLKVTGRAPRYDGSVHLVGAGIYPPNYIQYTTPTKNGEKGSPMASYRNPGHYIPFDVKCQDQHIPATQSPLMVHKPRTVNWRRVEGDVFTCEDKSHDEFGLTYAGPVNLKGVALLHGPKDDSFAKAILDNPFTLIPVPHDGAAHAIERGQAPPVEPIMPLGSTEESREEILSFRIQDLEEQNRMLQEQCQHLSQSKYGLELELAASTKTTKVQIMEEEPEPLSQAPETKVQSPAIEKRKPGRPKGSGKKIKTAA